MWSFMKSRKTGGRHDQAAKRAFRPSGDRLEAREVLNAATALVLAQRAALSAAQRVSPTVLTNSRAHALFSGVPVFRQVTAATTFAGNIQPRAINLGLSLSGGGGGGINFNVPNAGRLSGSPSGFGSLFSNNAATANLNAVTNGLAFTNGTAFAGSTVGFPAGNTATNGLAFTNGLGIGGAGLASTAGLNTTNGLAFTNGLGFSNRSLVGQFNSPVTSGLTFTNGLGFGGVNSTGFTSGQSAASGLTFTNGLGFSNPAFSPFNGVTRNFGAGAATVSTGLTGGGFSIMPGGTMML